MKKIIIISLFLMFSTAFVSIALTSNADNEKHHHQVIHQNETNKIELYTKVVDSYISSLNEKNLEGILSLYADNATVEDPVGSKIVEGKEALRQFYSGAVTIDLTLTRTGPVRIAGVEAAFPFQLLMEVDGTPMITDIIDVFRFDEEGKIVSMRAFWGESNRRVVSLTF